MTQVFKLRASKCRVKCPDTSCEHTFDTFAIMDIMKKEEKARYSGVVKEIMLKDTSGTTLPLMKKVVAVQECMTLKCPACQATVDPTPDGCSAVMCLNCGAHYCNVCFECFNTGKADTDRAAAHTHAAKHATHVAPNRRSAFLPNHIVEKGQKELLGKIVKRTVVDLVLSEIQEGEDQPPLSDLLHEVDMIIVIVEAELRDLGIKITQVRKDAGAEIRARLRQIVKGAGYTPPKRKRVTSGSPADLDDAEEAVEKAPAADSATGTGAAQVSVSGRKTRSSTVAGTARAAAAVAAIEDGNQQRVEYPHKPVDGWISVDKNSDKKSKRKKEAKEESPRDDGKMTTRGAGASSSSSSGQGAESTEMEVETLSDMPEESGTQTVKKGGAAFANAILSDNQIAVKQLLTIPDEEFDFDYVDTRHGHPLSSLSILTGKYDLAMNLLTRGADPLKHNTSGRTVLYIAVEAGACELVEIMLDMLSLKGIDAVNMISTTEIQAYRPLHVAARYNHGRICELLISRGAELDVREGEHGYTALTLGLVLGHEWSSIVLVNAGAQVTTAVKSNNGRSPMFVAAEKGLGEVIELVLRTRKDFNVNDHVVVPSGLRLLHVAAFHKRAHVVKMLIEKGADVNAMDKEHKSSTLNMALIGKCPICAAALVASGADSKSVNKLGRFPFDFALEHGISDVVRMFLDVCGADVNACTNTKDEHNLPLNRVIAKGHRHLVPLLLEKGANVDSVGAVTAPLVTAAGVDDSWTFQHLLEKGASIEARRADGHTLMHLVAQNGNNAMLQALIDHGADINERFQVQDAPFSFPLHVAADKNDGSAAIVNKMVMLGANIELKDGEGKTALDVATQKDNLTVAAILAKAAANKAAAGGEEGGEKKSPAKPQKPKKP